jgi:hypothetical protein
MAHMDVVPVEAGTEKSMMLAERWIATFKCSPVLKRKLNEEGG